MELLTHTKSCRTSLLNVIRCRKRGIYLPLLFILHNIRIYYFSKVDDMIVLVGVVVAHFREWRIELAAPLLVEVGCPPPDDR